MEYLVSIEDSSYHWWQVELLIESFKLRGLQDQLVVAVAPTRDSKPRNFTRNLRAHQRKFSHPNYGRAKQCLPLNKSYAAQVALENGEISQPFCLIDPDMALVRPVPDPVENITFALRWPFTVEYLDAHGVDVRPHLAKILEDRNLPARDLWLPVGSVTTFRDVPLDLFRRAVYWAERLETDRQIKTGEAESWWETPRAGWAVAMLDYYGGLTFRGVADYEMTLVENRADASFVHYQHGLPPVWGKNMYTYVPPDAFCMGGPTPFEVMLEHNPTAATNFFQEVIRSYLGDKA